MAKRSAAVSFAAVPLDELSSVPLYRQVYERLRTAILMGQLTPGTRLPSTREMAIELGVSRNTLMNAFDQLLAEGYVEGHVGSGTFVSRTLPEDLLEARLKTRRTIHVPPAGRALSHRGKILATTPMTVTVPAPGLSPFMPGTPALEEFPIAVWSRLVARHWRDLPRDFLNYGAAAGYMPLRKAIAAYLGPSRGVHCEPEQIIVVSGTQQALDLATRVLLDGGDPVLVEGHCYPAARAALLGAGAFLVHVPMDEAGLDISAAVAQSAAARMAYVTPSHQYPLGVTMSLPRRLALLDWANRTKAWVLEDDYDSEYRYVGRPLAALQGLDRGGRVIYLGTFSKVLFPSMRIGYMVVPPDLVDAFVAARRVVGWCSPTIDQAVLADFISEGHFTRHIRRMRPIYAERRAALIDALERQLGDLLKIEPGDAGIHLTCSLPGHLDDKAMAREAAAHGVVVKPLSAFTEEETVPVRRGLVLGYGAYSLRQIKEATNKLAVALKAFKTASPVSKHPARRRR